MRTTMQSIKFKFYIALVFFLFAADAFAVRPYRPGDWVTYRGFQHVNECDLGRDYVYFATKGGIFRYDIWKSKWDDPLTIARIPGGTVNLDEVYVVAYDKDKHWMWCGTSGGLLSYNSLADSWYDYDIPGKSVRITSIGFKEEDIWLEGGSKVFTGSRITGNLREATYEELYAAMPIEWRGSRNATPSTFPQYFTNTTKLSFEPTGRLNDSYFKHYNVTCTVNDPMRRVTYLGFGSYGIGIVDDYSLRMDVYRSGPSNPRVKQIILDGDNFYVAGGVFASVTKDEGFWEKYPTSENMGLESDYGEDISLYGDKIFIATKLGLSVYNKSNGRFYDYDTFNNLPDNHVTALAAIDREMWIGTAQGLCLMGLSSESISRITDRAVKSRYIYDIFAEGNYVWVGTEYGLYLHDRKVGDWTYVKGSDEMMDSQVFAIRGNGDESWFAREKGIEYYDKKSGEFSAYSGIFMHNHNATSILPGDSLVWVGTNGGLFKLHRSENFWVQYTVEDGLPSNKVNCILQDGDYLWLGTDKGLCRFYWNDPYRLD